MKNRLILLAVNTFILICILLAGLKVYSYLTNTSIDINLNITNISSLIIVYSFIFLCSCQAWKTAFKATTGVTLKFSHAVSQTAYMLTSKYVPGKIWGFVARGVTAPIYGYSSTSTIHASVFEQIITMQSGLLLGISLLAYSYNEYAGITLFILFHIIPYTIYSLGINILLFPLARISAISKKLKGIEKIQHINKTVFIKAYYFYTLLWILIALSMTIFLDLLSITYDSKLLFAISGVYIISVLVGFLAIFAPGGIGVREGMFVTLTLNILPLHHAIEISVLIRIVLTIYDLLAGIIGHILHIHSTK